MPRRCPAFRWFAACHAGIVDPSPGRVDNPAPRRGDLTKEWQEGNQKMPKHRGLRWDNAERVVRLVLGLVVEAIKLINQSHWFQ